MYVDRHPVYEHFIETSYQWTVYVQTCNLSCMNTSDKLATLYLGLLSELKVHILNTSLMFSHQRFQVHINAVRCASDHSYTNKVQVRTDQTLHYMSTYSTGHQHSSAVYPELNPSFFISSVFYAALKNISFIWHGQHYGAEKPGSAQEKPQDHPQIAGRPSHLCPAWAGCKCELTGNVLVRIIALR